MRRRSIDNPIAHVITFLPWLVVVSVPQVAVRRFDTALLSVQAIVGINAELIHGRHLHAAV